MVHRIYPAEIQLNKANASDSEAAFFDLNSSIYNDTVSTKIYDKRDDFDFEIVNFPFLDGDIPRRPAYGVWCIYVGFRSGGGGGGGGGRAGGRSHIGGQFPQWVPI